jgi:alpha-1,3-glucosyltransferase
MLGVAMSQPSLRSKFFKLLRIATAVLLTFAVCWLPYLSSLDDMYQVLLRLFPFNRGIFEDKVASFWCAAEIIIKFKKLFAVKSLINMSAATTLLSCVPSCIHVLMKPTKTNFKLSLIISSLSFFLFSYQVHEKSILLPALAAFLVLDKHPLAVLWFAVSSTVSLQPLLEKDGLVIPYIALLTLLLVIFFSVNGDLGLTSCDTLVKKGKALVFLVSFTGSLALFLTSQIVPAPKRYPDIYPVLFAIWSCGHFIAFFVYFNYVQLFMSAQTYDKTNGSNNLDITSPVRVKKNL